MGNQRKDSLVPYHVGSIHTPIYVVPIHIREIHQRENHDCWSMV